VRSSERLIAETRATEIYCRKRENENEIVARCIYQRRLCRSAWVRFTSPSVCLSVFVCLSVCPQHNSEMNDPKVFKLAVGNDIGI